MAELTRVCEVSTVVVARPSTRGPASEINASYNCDLREAFDKILAHPVFQGIQSEFGLHGAVCDVNKYNHDLSERSFHRFEGNVFMIAVNGNQRTQFASGCYG